MYVQHSYIYIYIYTYTYISTLDYVIKADGVELDHNEGNIYINIHIYIHLSTCK
jgi:hypothetical protein